VFRTLYAGRIVDRALKAAWAFPKEQGRLRSGLPA